MADLSSLMDDISQSPLVTALKGLISPPAPGVQQIAQPSEDYMTGPEEPGPATYKQDTATLLGNLIKYGPVMGALNYARGNPAAVSNIAKEATNTVSTLSPFFDLTGGVRTGLEKAALESTPLLGKLGTKAAAAWRQYMAAKPVLKAGELGAPLTAVEGMLDRGWIMPDGKMVQVDMDHPDSLAKALGISKQTAVTNYPEIAGNYGLTRVMIRPKSQTPIAEMFGAPTDGQIQSLRELEKSYGQPVEFAFTDPATKKVLGQGAGVNQIRRTYDNLHLLDPKPVEALKAGQSELAIALQKTAEKPVNMGARGANATEPARTYAEGVATKPIAKKGWPPSPGKPIGDNIWVRQATTPDNKNRTLMVQFSNDVIKGAEGDVATGKLYDEYSNNLYSQRAGYDRPEDFWEIPQWQAAVAHNLPRADHYTVRNMEEASSFLRQAGYKNVLFSALDVNAPLVHQLAGDYEGAVAVGGYTNMKQFADLPNVTVHPSIESFVKSEGANYSEGFDYRHFSGTKTVPRLTMSDGCRHSCAFCTVPKTITETSPDAILQQADAFAKDLPSKLVYINDKTFGQAKNHTMLPEVFDRIKAKNPNFEGFVIQTTAAQMKQFTPEFLKDAGVKYVELGIESYNDPILKAVKKPATEKVINEAADKLRKAGVTLIPNIMIGLPGETAESYARTMNFLNENQDIISHVNITNTSVYDNTALANELKEVTAKDRSQAVLQKSWMTDPETHSSFQKQVFQFGNKQLGKVPFAQAPGAPGDVDMSRLLRPPSYPMAAGE